MDTEQTLVRYIPKKNIQLVFTLADLGRLSSSSSICIFPLFLTEDELASAIESLRCREIKTLIVVNVQSEREKAIRSALPPSQVIVPTLDSIIDQDDSDSLFEELKESLNNLSGSVHFSLKSTCSLLTAVTAADVVILRQDKRLLIDTRSDKQFSIPFQDWAVHLGNKISYSGSGAEEFLFRSENSHWYGYAMLSYGHVSGFVFVKALANNMAPDLLQRKLLRPYLLMAQFGDSQMPVHQKKQKGEFLMSILYGMVENRESVKKECEIYHISFETLRYIWILKLKNFNADNHNPNHILRICEQCFPHNYFVFDQDQVISIHEKTDESDEAAAQRIYNVMERIERNYPKLECVVGNSRAYPDLYDLRMGYQDALFSLRIGQMLFPNNNKFLTFNDLLLYHFLIGQKDNPILQRLYKNTIAILVKNDADYSDHLVETIEVLSRTDFHISDASEALGVHRNTMYQRIEKIRNLTGLDLKSQEGKLVILLGLKLKLISSMDG